MNVAKGPCWIWPNVSPRGYGWIFLNGRKRPAHRVSYESMVGPIPPGTELDHLCRNTKCANPAHLEAVTHLENVRRGDSGKPGKQKTHCQRGHLFTDATTGLCRGRRFCKICSRAATARSYANQSAAVRAAAAARRRDRYRAKARGHLATWTGTGVGSEVA